MSLKKIFYKIRRNLMSPNAWARYNGIKMGKGCWLSTKEIPPEGYLVELGDYVRIAAHASIYTHGAIWSLRKYYHNPTLEQFGKVKIGSYTSIGAYSMIMPGVTIGERCIIAGGAVVTRSVPDGCMVAGNPAKFIGYTEDFYKKVKEKHDFACKMLNQKEKETFLLAQPEDKFIKKGFIQITP